MSEKRVYAPSECAVFFKAKETYGGFSNMAGGYPLRIGAHTIPSSEALYQAMRFPDNALLQEHITAPPSGMTAKMIARGEIAKSRADWNQVCIPIMRWTLRIKALYHAADMMTLFAMSDDRPIVERSSKSDFWGAIEQPDGTLVGQNILGRLWMEIRAEVREKGIYETVAPPAVSGMVFRGQPVVEQSWKDAQEWKFVSKKS